MSDNPAKQTYTVWHLKNSDFSFKTINFPADYDKVAECRTTNDEMVVAHDTMYDENWKDSPDVTTFGAVRDTKPGDVVVTPDQRAFLIDLLGHEMALTPISWQVEQPLDDDLDQDP